MQEQKSQLACKKKAQLSLASTFRSLQHENLTTSSHLSMDRRHCQHLHIEDPLVVIHPLHARQLYLQRSNEDKI